MNQLDNSVFGSLRFKYFPTPVDYFYYELFLFEGDEEEEVYIDPDGDEPSIVMLGMTNSLSPKIKNTLQFVYKNDVLVRKRLSEDEVTNILRFLKKIEIPLLMCPEEMVIVDPEINSRIYIETGAISLRYTWTNANEISSPEKMKNIVEFLDFICEYLNVDFSKLEMPIYL